MRVSDLFRLDRRVALVTGANTGLGQAVALALADAGADLVLVGRSDPSATSRAIAALGRRAHWVRVELGKVAAIEPMLQEAWHAFGGVDVLVNNAGIIRRSPALEFTEADWDQVLDVNLKSAFFLSQALARRWLAADRPGKIVNIASLLSFQGGVRVASYTASKSGLAGLTRLMANEWAARGINVNAIAPGYFATNNTEALRADPERSREILGRIPAGRWGTPSDLGGAAVFLASRASDYVHGAIVPVDGGWLAR
jgi:2-deoxy-D-gluconate 3-dehydrogenase